MTAHLDVRPGRLSVCLAMRFDNFDDGSWIAFHALPIVVGFLASAPFGWFLTDASGLHMRAAVALGRDPDRSAEIRRCLDADGVRRSLTLFGIGCREVRSIHVGFTLERLWELMQDGLGVVVTSPPDRTCQDVLARYAEVPAGTMFVEAMTRHLSPTPRSGTASVTASPPAWRAASTRRRTPRR